MLAASVLAPATEPRAAVGPYWNSKVAGIRPPFDAVAFRVAVVVPTAVAGEVATCGGASSNAPISHAAPCGRGTPRASVAAHSAPPASIAGLPGSSAWVGTAP